VCILPTAATSHRAHTSAARSHDCSAPFSLEDASLLSQIALPQEWRKFDDLDAARNCARALKCSIALLIVAVIPRPAGSAEQRNTPKFTPARFHSTTSNACAYSMRDGVKPTRHPHTRGTPHLLLTAPLWADSRIAPNPSATSQRSLTAPMSPMSVVQAATSVFAGRRASTSRRYFMNRPLRGPLNTMR